MITPIIPLRYNPNRKYYGNTDNLINIRHSIDSLLFHEEVVEKIIISNNTPKSISEDDIQLKYLYEIYGNNPRVKIIDLNGVECLFNRAWLLNVGIKNAETDLYMAYDIDCIVSPEFTEIISKISNDEFSRSCFVIQNYGFYERRNIDWLNFEYPQKFNEIIKDLAPRPGDGMLIAKVEYLHKMRGYCEEFQVWGGEDDDVIWRLKNMDIGRVKREEIKCIHQPHNSYEDIYISDLEKKHLENRFRVLERGLGTVARNKINDERWGSETGPNLSSI